MGRYLANRLLQAAVATFGVLTIVFLVMRLSVTRTDVVCTWADLIPLASYISLSAR